MAWHCIQLTYELHGPLHVGYHKVGNVQRTRYYLPARNLWGAVTERLTRCGFSTKGAPEGDYQQIGDWVQKHCVFSYFFVRDGQDSLLFPLFTEKGVWYGGLAQAEFERRYLDSHVTAALDAATTSAESGSLHEVECIRPYDASGQRTRLAGWAFLDEDAFAILGHEARWQFWLGELQVGGERRSGFGRLRLDHFVQGNLEHEGYAVFLDGPRPRVRIKAEKPLLAHTVTKGIQARGLIEPLVGRETYHSYAFGFNLTQGIICWAPGSMLIASALVQLEGKGYWRSIPEG